MKTYRIGQRVLVDNQTAIILHRITTYTYLVRILATGEETYVHESSISPI